MKRFLLLTVLIACTIAGHGQAAYIDYADEAYNEKDYDIAAQFYAAAATGNKSFLPTRYPYQTTIQMGGKLDKKQQLYSTQRAADSYRLHFDYENAAVFYEKLFELKDGATPENRIHYAMCLRAQESLDSALVQLNNALNDSIEISGDLQSQGVFEKASVELAIEGIAHPEFAQIEKVGDEGVNQGGTSNYGAVLLDDGQYLFTTTRDLNKKFDTYAHSVLTTSDSGVVAVLGDEKMKREYAGASFSSETNRIYFNTWVVLEGRNLAQIAFKTVGDESFTVLDGITTGASRDLYPFINNEGTRLYFASDRPGGKGGLDIWSVSIDAASGQAQGAPSLMSGSVNTDKDEITPAMVNGEFYFSSDGHPGYGGLDMFRSDVKGSAPENLGYPINSTADDAYLVPGFEEDSYYFSSDREAGCCLELFKFDIYHLFVEGKVVEEPTNEPLDSAEVFVVDSLSGDTLQTGYTDENGEYQFEVGLNQSLMVLGTKPFYSKDSTYVSTDGADEYMGTTALVQTDLVIRPLIFKLENVYFDFDKATLRPESNKTLDSLVNILNFYPRMRIEIGGHTDAIGTEAYNQKLSQERAQAVVNYLIEKGINIDRLEAMGYGESMPAAPNRTEDGRDNREGRALNRRTEFKILEQ